MAKKRSLRPRKKLSPRPRKKRSYKKNKIKKSKVKIGGSSGITEQDHKALEALAEAFDKWKYFGHPPLNEWFKTPEGMEEFRKLRIHELQLPMLLVDLIKSYETTPEGPETQLYIHFFKKLQEPVLPPLDFGALRKSNQKWPSIDMALANHKCGPSHPCPTPQPQRFFVDAGAAQNNQMNFDQIGNEFTSFLGEEGKLL